MNHLVDQYFDSLTDKRVAVLGIGVSNRPLIRMLLARGICVLACDKTPREKLDAEVLELEQAGAVLHVGEHYLDDVQADIVFRTPGMHPDIPALRQLRESGAEITSEMEVFFEVCPCHIIAVTGSDGKTTTTTLIAKILEHAGHRVWIGGNIGAPLLPQAADMTPTDIAVVELSSFQLMTMERSADIAVVTNVAPNHLDVHKDMAEYVQAKKNVFAHQSEAGKVILNYDNAITRGFAADANGTVEYFSRQTKPENGVYLEDGVIYRNGKRIMAAADIRIPGVHNIENYMAAACAVEGLATEEDIDEIARTFAGVEHRIEFVRELDGVKYYNDSIASSPSRTIAGLHSFHQKLVLIAGGYDKKIPFEPMAETVCQKVKHLILMGVTADKIEKAITECPAYDGNNIKIHRVFSMEEAVKKASDIAVEGDVVTLSPACASFDLYPNFEARGIHYKNIVKGL